MTRSPAALLAVVAVGLAFSVGPASTAPSSAARAEPSPARAALWASVAAVPASSAAQPLAGVRIALDPGHQLGNHNFLTQIRRLVPAGGFSKPCNTTGTETNAGYPEPTFNFALARAIRSRLQELGATVLFTRGANSELLWGPCVDARGRFGAKVGARLAVSLHADGAPSAGHGFHVIEPASRAPWTTDIAVRSRRLAHALRDALDSRHIARSTYVGNGTGLNVRSDLATLNLSDVPIAMIEIGNMRNAGDAARMTSSSGRSTYAAAVVDGIRRYLGL